MYQRYRIKKIATEVVYGEKITELGWDEAWIYNVLQHTEDPEQVIGNARRAAMTVRLFEWIDIPPHEGHPHMLTEESLSGWLGHPGQVGELRESGCFGRAFYGVFKTSP